MSDTLFGAIAGGVIAVVGGFAGAWFIRWRDDKRANRERIVRRVGTINVLLSELAENHTNLELRMNSATGRTRMDVYDRAFNDSQAFMARELSSRAWELLFKAYGSLRSPSYLYSVYSPAQGPDVYQIRKETAAEVLNEIEAAAAALRNERGPWSPVP